jgi:two-component system, response regulator YesN
MIRVMVVDDEYLAREGMKRTVDWESVGCLLIGEAENGQEAVEKARSLKPDIIITDIQMPGMDGLRMAEKVREFHRECRFIIITGYDEFEYAKAAIKIDAVDFLLKPIDHRELMEALQKAIEQHKKLRLESSAITERILLDAMRGNFVNRDGMLKLLSERGICLNRLYIILMENDRYGQIIEEGKESLLYEQNRIIKDVVNRNFSENCCVIECHRDRLAAVLGVEVFKGRSDFEGKLEAIQKDIFNSCNTTVTMGISKEVELSNISTAYSQAKKALHNKIYSGKNSINYSRDEEFDRISVDKFIARVKEELRLALKARDKKGIDTHLKRLYFDVFKSCKVEEYTVRQISIEVIIQALNLLSENAILPAKLFGSDFNIYKQAANLHTLNELYEMVLGYHLRVIDFVREQRCEAEETGIEKAVEYIKAHYTEDISLSNVARLCYLSESYLSRKIKKVLGMGFAEYVTKLRMEKAIDCLREPAARITEVAAKTGYPDYRYFSQIFKKYTGYSPSEFVKRRD